MLTIEDVLAESKKNNRVCPQPQKWNELYEMLPEKSRKGNGWEPSLPLILGAWWDTPQLSKMMRFEEHLRWADTHHCLAQVHSFLAGLTEDQWHHLGE